ncbi:hypothetical protein V2J09_016827 [Rumex salicifolius]
MRRLVTVEIGGSLIFQLDFAEEFRIYESLEPFKIHKSEQFVGGRNSKPAPSFVFEVGGPFVYNARKCNRLLKRLEKRQRGMAGREEKILVLVRLRPLNEKEITKNEVADWECINDSTVLYRNSLQERSGLPTAYTYDRVFSGDCSTKQVYEEGTRDITLSVVSGINSSVFAYGQTSSGKTYTMSGITEYTVADIYDYIQRHEERAFVLKFSAMEIYNENVRDLLSSDNTPLRLLDDPERGTIVEKLTEETLKDWNHLKKLLSICEALRKIGETSLNETSSRSHQILKLTIESSAREFIGKENSSTLSASVFFIDLAGSERASQALSAGTRLKEGCHINRSLLTLGNVIRKLSKGRQGHINYRDSKLTRILQPCLGGNARTSIICTLSPARTHVEQSRNTLLFASCAKEVTTNAQVNVVMSDKALVKHLQKELARLESELRTPAPTSSSCNCAVTIRKKDLQIEKMEKDIRELTKQRALAQSRVEDLLQMIGNDETPSSKKKGHRQRSKWGAAEKWEDECSASELSEFDHHGQDRDLKNYTRTQSSGVDIEDHSLVNDEVTSANLEVPEDQCKEVRCIETGVPRSADQLQSFSPPSSESSQVLDSFTFGNGHVTNEENSTGSNQQNGFSYGTLEQRILDVQRTINSLNQPYSKKSRSQDIDPNASCSPRTGMEEYCDRTPPSESDKAFPGRPGGFSKSFTPFDYGSSSAKLSRNNSHSSAGTDFVDDMKSQGSRNMADEEIPTIGSFVAGLKDARFQYEKQIRDCRVWESGAQSDEAGNNQRNLPSPDLFHQFESLRGRIIELWHACSVSLVHRTYFFLLFKGDPTDSIYLEVELRRLSFLKESSCQGQLAAEEGRQSLKSASSLRSLRRERETLSKLIKRRYSEEERKKLYENWGIGIDSKRRRQQLVSKLWSDTKDMNHIKESCCIVAKLVKFSEQGQAIKEMFGLSFTPPRMIRRSFKWANSVTNRL